MKRRFYNKKDYVLDDVNQRLLLNEEFCQKLWKIKKITGTTLAQIINENAYKTPFDLYCHIFSLTPPLLISKYVEAGNVLEPKIIDFLNSKHPKHKIKHIVAKEVGYDYFPKDAFFGGVPDAFCETEDLIIEIKTSSLKNKKEVTKGKIPQNYIRQAQLYCYLMNKTKYRFVYAFIDETKGEYLHPEKIKLSGENTFIIDFSFKKEDFENIIGYAKRWYIHYINNSSYSPKYDLNKDKMLLDYLRCETPQEWEKLLKKWQSQGLADSKVEL